MSFLSELVNHIIQIKLLPEFCMKINEKFKSDLKSIYYKTLGSIAKYLIGKSAIDDLHMNFHPAGEPEAFICCVAKDSK